MYISLATIDVWELDAGFDAATLFEALNILCTETDLLVIGSYNPSEPALKWLRDNELELSNSAKPFEDSFDVNRRQFPVGKANAMHAKRERLLELSALSGNDHGSLDKKLFFDHVVAYRPGKPILPLLSFHDAFDGGELYLSGHYSKTMARSFARRLGVKVRSVINPENVIVPPSIQSVTNT